LEEPAPIEPGVAYPYTLDLGPTSLLFRRGPCLRLTVSSSHFPAYARNLNTGGFHADEVEPRTATQTILHDVDHLSVLTLPIVTAR
jgi:predicted acyl esterase